MADAFNLLQMYQDDDDDDDTIQNDVVPIHRHELDDVEERGSDSPRRDESHNIIEELNINEAVSITTTINRVNSASNLVTEVKRSSIVDYGHDDVAMSPETEEGEIMGMSTGRVGFGDEFGSMREIPQRTPIVNVQSTTPKNVVDSPHLSVHGDVRHPEMIDSAMNDSDIEVQGVEISDEDSKYVDPLVKFLPPPPQEKCSDELQEKINKFLAYKRQGKSFNVEVRNRKDYRNPDFLRHAVRYQDIDEIGSCFSKDVFDPHGYDQNDFYDAIEIAINRERERKEQERKKSQKVEFVSGAPQSASVGITPKVMLPSPAVHNLPTSGAQSGSADLLNKEGRHNKKSKWDKVDGDKNLFSGRHENVSSVGAHAALLSAANAGAGYAVYAQQKRREAEERRSSDRKAEKRT